jgi:iron-sulfur cluster repair protein YtfE (RIC family)
MTTMTNRIDARALPDTYAVLQELERMTPGTEAVVRFDGQPLGVMECVYDCYPGRFQFTPLRRGPGTWRYCVAALDPSAPRSVAAYMQWDHDKMDDLLERTMHDIACENWRGALVCLGEFSEGLRRHIEIEERVLFPRFESATGTHVAGPTERMHEEHKQIIQAVECMVTALHARDADDVENWYVNLLAVFVEHNMREEQIVYPLVDRALTPPARDSLLRAMLLY